MLSESMVNLLKDLHPSGTRICLDKMGPDPHEQPSGSLGTVDFVDDIGTVHVKFDNGVSIGLIYEVDDWHKVREINRDKGEER